MNPRVPSPITTTLNAGGATFRATGAPQASSSLTFVSADSREASRERYGFSASEMDGQHHRPPSPTMQTRGCFTIIHQAQGSASSAGHGLPPQMNAYNNYGCMSAMMESMSKVNTRRGPVISPRNIPYIIRRMLLRR
ncbi:hypothetical protein DL93DRAFT_447410 [Clavulina sp. PMI_390]|nr:hypothetical protein DL93DRAFT_447410 [Clavulina sp. PMI_390]